MSRLPLIEELESSYMKKTIPEFNVGDTVRVQISIKEGDKERFQAFMGTVVAKKGQGLSETFTLYRNAYGSNMERVFMIHSPTISGVEVMRHGKVRRAKLYYLRGKSGKGAKVREQFRPDKAKVAIEAPVETSETSEA